MKFREFAHSRVFFEISNHVLHGERLEYAKILLWVLAALPFAIGSKIWRTLLKGMGVVTAALFLLLSLGISKGMRELFVKQVASFGENLADWVLYPFAILFACSRLLLGSLIHPSLFFRY